MKLKANEYIYSIKNLTYGEVRAIEYAYGQHIHNAVSGDFAETNDILAQLKARIEKKPIKETSSDEDFITIPKPKFKVGDVVSIPSGYSNGFTVYSRVYSPDKNMWFYSPNYEDNNSSMFLRLPELPAPKECFEESELELVERKEDDTRNSIGL